MSRRVIPVAFKESYGDIAVGTVASRLCGCGHFCDDHSVRCCDCFDDEVMCPVCEYRRSFIGLSK